MATESEASGSSGNRIVTIAEFVTRNQLRKPGTSGQNA
jgi:hypothetical protein